MLNSDARGCGLVDKICLTGAVQTQFASFDVRHQSHVQRRSLGLVNRAFVRL